MNTKQYRRRKFDRRTWRVHRSGISLFEVLIAMLVAAIGVFGVIVLIPFAWETAERGIDRENGINAAKNYITDLQAYGYGNAADSWYDDTYMYAATPVLDENEVYPHIPTIDMTGLDATNMTTSQPPLQRLVRRDGSFSPIIGGWPYLVDPTGAAQLGFPNFGQFPDTSTWLPAVVPDDFPTINRISFADPSAILFPIGGELAGRFSLSSDDLIFKEPATELGPPRQAYFSVTGATQLPDVKRQYQGKYQTATIVVPEDDDGKRYRIYVLVFKPGDREQTANRVFEVVDPADWTERIAKTDAMNDDIRENYNQIGLGGGDLMLSELETPGQPPLDDGDQIRNNDWMMLINYYKPETGDTKTYDDVQLGFYQVIHADRTSPTDTMTHSGRTVRPTTEGPAERTYSVTLQGTDFDLFRDWYLHDQDDPVINGMPVNAGDRTFRGTYAVSIPNVQVVYERTITAESVSKWTNQ